MTKLRHKKAQRLNAALSTIFTGMYL